VPIALWWHIPEDPHGAHELADITIATQREYDWDFVKMMPSGGYLPEALGCPVGEAVGPDAVVDPIDSPVRSAADWARLPDLDPSRGLLRDQVEAIRLVRRALGADTPILASVFAPTSVVKKLGMHLNYPAFLREQRSEVEPALRRITDGIKKLVSAYLDAGADGLYYAEQEAHNGVPRADFLEFARPYDLEILRSSGTRAWFNLPHICRTSIYPDLVSDYPAPAFSWESSAGLHPTMAEARTVWPGKTLVGGLDKRGPLLTGTPEEVAAEVRGVVETAGARRLIVAAGCVVPVGLPLENLRAARETVEDLH
jgi:uroporphyrinogen decarboxylase